MPPYTNGSIHMPVVCQIEKSKLALAISRRQIKAVNIYELYTNGPLLIP
jgi:hypothetical protein